MNLDITLPSQLKQIVGGAALESVISGDDVIELLCKETCPVILKVFMCSLLQLKRVVQY